VDSFRGVKAFLCRIGCAWNVRKTYRRGAGREKKSKVQTAEGCSENSQGFAKNAALAIFLPPLRGLDLGLFLTTAEHAENKRNHCTRSIFLFDRSVLCVSRVCFRFFHGLQATLDLKREQKLL